MRSFFVVDIFNLNLDLDPNKPSLHSKYTLGVLELDPYQDAFHLDPISRQIETSRRTLPADSLFCPFIIKKILMQNI